MTKDNHIQINIRLFDAIQNADVEIGKYDNVMLQDLNISGVMKDVKQAFGKIIKQFEIDITNAKEGKS